MTAELVGSALLAGTVIGSGILAADLALGNAAVALLGNTIATGAILFVLIVTLVVIFHNPACETSRNVLSIIQATGREPEVVLYLDEGWRRGPLPALLAAAGLTVRGALRETKSPAAELGLLEPGVTEEPLLSAMLAHPILVNRPIVATPKGVRLCRPSQTVLGLLDRPPATPVYKEDGRLVFDPAGKQAG